MSNAPGSSARSGPSYPCPYCHNAALESVATAPYVRGFLVAYQIGTKTFNGCVPCVRKKVFGEARLALGLGWCSVTALYINPCLIVFNLICGATVGKNDAGVTAIADGNVAAAEKALLERVAANMGVQSTP